MTEVWKDVPGYPGLRASSEGRVWFPATTTNGRTYKTAPTFGQLARYRNGRPARMIVFMRGYRTLKIARLVCLAFHGKPPRRKTYCLHRNEDPTDNRPDNLIWGTQMENLNAPGFLKLRGELTKARYRP